MATPELYIRIEVLNANGEPVEVRELSHDLGDAGVIGDVECALDEIAEAYESDAD